MCAVILALIVASELIAVVIFATSVIELKLKDAVEPKLSAIVIVPNELMFETLLLIILPLVSWVTDVIVLEDLAFTLANLVEIFPILNSPVIIVSPGVSVYPVPCSVTFIALSNPSLFSTAVAFAWVPFVDCVICISGTSKY